MRLSVLCARKGSARLGLGLEFRARAAHSGLEPEMGRNAALETSTEVGSSADVAIAAETGTPSIDGFGMEGGGAHGVDDYVDFATLAPRAYLMARMLMEAGRDQPKR